MVFAQEKKEIKYFGGNYRDPFLSALPQEKPVEKIEKVNPPDLKLQGIVWGSDKPRAIINGIVLGKGDKIGEAEIVEIRKEGVEFIYKEHFFFLERASGIIKEKTD
ncbi:MAG: general secretion pathway protein GspB [Candidatus Omnitrophica bacterium]|nr:general secretion pathway protein GspB [Candidatus Omnitrophota bacterium]